MPAGSWSGVHLNSLSVRRVHQVHGMVQVQGPLQGPLGRQGCLLRQPSSRRLVTLPGCQAPHLPLQGQMLQGQLLVLCGLPLARLPLLLAQQLLLKLLLLGGACGLPCSRLLPPAPVTAGGTAGGGGVPELVPLLDQQSLAAAAGAMAAGRQLQPRLACPESGTGRSLQAMQVPVTASHA